MFFAGLLFCPRFSSSRLSRRKNGQSQSNGMTGRIGKKIGKNQQRLSRLRSLRSLGGLKSLKSLRNLRLRKPSDLGWRWFFMTWYFCPLVNPQEMGNQLGMFLCLLSVSECWWPLDRFQGGMGTRRMIRMMMETGPTGPKMMIGPRAKKLIGIKMATRLRMWPLRSKQRIRQRPNGKRRRTWKQKCSWPMFGKWISAMMPWRFWWECKILWVIRNYVVNTPVVAIMIWLGLDILWNMVGHKSIRSCWNMKSNWLCHSCSKQSRFFSHPWVWLWRWPLQSEAWWSMLPHSSPVFSATQPPIEVLRRRTHTVGFFGSQLQMSKGTRNKVLVARTCA